MNGALYIIHALIVTVETRITPHISSFMEYIICSMKMENCDAMGTRVACGMISDLSNTIEEGINQWLPQIMECLLRILVDNSFDSEAKLIAIIAFGDVSLAAGASNFLRYFSEIQTSFI